MMKQVIEPKKESLLKNLNSNEEILKACEANNELKKPLRKVYKDSYGVTKKKLSDLSLKGNKFKITEAATEEDLEHFNIILAIHLDN